MNIGDYVAKNPSTWIPSEFDQWGAGEGIGMVVGFDGELVDIRWGAGRAWQRREELTIVSSEAAPS